MKKLFYFFALSAIMLGMASCGDDVKLNKFKVEAEPSQDKIILTITAPNEDMYFAYGLEYKNQFMRDPQYYRDHITNYYWGTGTEYQEYDSYMLPSTEYILFICECDEYMQPVGELEYMTIRTPDMEEEIWTDQSEEQPTQHLTGSVYKDEDGDICVHAMTDDETYDTKIWLPAKTGTFTTKDLVRTYMSKDPYLYSKSVGYDCYIYNVNIKGWQDTKTGHYIYEGTVDVFFPAPNPNRRYTIHADCEYVE